MSGETRALRLSAGAALGLGAVALGAGLATGSGAILLDGAFNLCYFATALATLRVARLLRRPDDDAYPFGYVHFEPLINAAKGCLILAVSLVALAGAARSLWRGGAAVEAGPALAYAAAAAAICLAVMLRLGREAARLRSPLVEADRQNWAVNAAISGGMAAAFVVALALEGAGRAQAARLVDPILVGLICTATLGVPVRMIAGGLLGLLQRAPHGPVGAAMRALAEAELGGLPVRALHVRVVRPGRTTYALMHVVLEREAAADLRLAEIDRRRARIVTAIVRAHGPVLVDVIFTRLAHLAEPAVQMAPEVVEGA